MWFSHYSSFQLSHKKYTLFSLKPLFSNSTFVYFWDVVSHHPHLLPQYCQSHLHLACLFASHLCHLPHILLQIHLISQLEYHLWHNVFFIQIPIILKCIPYITWLESLEDPEQLLVILVSIVCPAITKPFEMISPSYMILVFLWCIALRLSSSVLELALIYKSSSQTSLVFS